MRHPVGTQPPVDVSPPKGGSLETALTEVWWNWRNSLLASPRFQRWAGRFPLTRPIAQQRARTLFDLCAGFVYSQVLLACMRLRILDHLADEPCTVDQLAVRVQLSREMTERLLTAAAGLDLVSHRSRGRYGLGQLGAALLGNPALTAMIEHHALLYSDLADPVSLLRGRASPTALAQYWRYAREREPSHLVEAEVAAYSELMASSQQLIAAQILDAYPLGRHRCLLDVGGGHGAFVVAAASRWPSLQLGLFDLPAVSGRAAAILSQAGLQGRARTYAGDFFRDPLPRGADVMSLIRILHDHDDVPARQLLARLHDALPPGGTLLIAEPMCGTSGARAAVDAYFSFYLLAMGSGRPRRPDEIIGMLSDAGFRRIREVSTTYPFLTRLLVAQA